MLAVNLARQDSPAGQRMGLPPDEVILGSSLAMESVRRKVEKVAEASVPLLIQGDSGTGKEVLAHVIHAHSPRSSAPFVKVNCAAIPGTLLESELFGFEKGAFTGAFASKPGRLELTGGGTLFLDEIAELDQCLQAKLLQVLQDGLFCRIGGSEERRVDARVICATNRDLEEDIAAGSFRADLFYRINVISIQMPRLSERRGDIPVLVDYFLQHFNRSFQRSAPPIRREVVQRLERCSWPGNIRELQNWVARYVLLGMETEPAYETPERGLPHLNVQVDEDGKIPLKKITRDASREMERHLILEVLNANRWNRRKTAQILSISYRALIYKIRQAGLSKKDRERNTDEPDSSSSRPTATAEF